MKCLPGYAAVGEILATGADAAYSAGDLVLAHVPHQSIARFDSRGPVCLRLPEGLAPDLAPMARLAQVSAVSIRLSLLLALLTTHTSFVYVLTVQSMNWQVKS